MMYVYVETRPLGGGDYELQDITCKGRRCRNRGMGTTAELNADGWRDQCVTDLSTSYQTAVDLLRERHDSIIGKRHYGSMCSTCLARAKVIHRDTFYCVLRERVIEPVSA